MSYIHFTTDLGTEQSFYRGNEVELKVQGGALHGAILRPTSMDDALALQSWVNRYIDIIRDSKQIFVITGHGHRPFDPEGGCMAQGTAQEFRCYSERRAPDGTRIGGESIWGISHDDAETAEARCRKTILEKYPNAEIRDLTRVLPIPT